MDVRGERYWYLGGVRDWAIAQAAVRVARLNRYRWGRVLRLTLVRTLSRCLTSAKITRADGMHLYVPALDSSLMHRVLAGCPFDMGLEVALRRIVRPGDVVVDGGAHVGAFSLVAARLAGPSGIVVAFEPNPDLFQLLTLNVSSNRMTQNVVVEQVALGDQAGDSDFFFSRHVTTHGSLVGPAYPGQAKRCVRVVTLDGWLRQQGLSAQVIKLDLEGGEALALRGMTHTLRLARGLIFEVNGPRLSSMGVHASDLVALARREGGFRAGAVASDDSDTLLPLEAMDDEVRRLGWSNVILCKDADCLGGSVDRVDEDGCYWATRWGGYPDAGEANRPAPAP